MMKEIEIIFNQKKYRIRMDQGVDISIPLDNHHGPNCFNAPPYKAEPLKSGNFIGDTRKGSPVNFYNISLNPHGNGTHTECIGHITKERYSINEQLSEHHFMAQVVSCALKKHQGDLIVEKEPLINAVNGVSALIIRTRPNSVAKKQKNYTNTNPPYLSTDAMKFIVEQNIKHLMVDLPSVDREEDGGSLKCHKIFWNYPEAPRMNATITELIFVPDTVKDGFYFCNLQIPSFQLDAAPSKVILYPLHSTE